MNSDTLTTAGLATTFTIVAGIAYKIYRTVNHKQCKSRCCGKEMEVSLDIDTTIENPMNSNRKEEV